MPAMTAAWSPPRPRSWGCACRAAAAYVGARADLAVRLVGRQLDAPGFVLDLLFEDAGRQVIGAGVLAEGHVADLAPGTDRAALGLEQHFQDLGRRRVAHDVARIVH